MGSLFRIEKWNNGNQLSPPIPMYPVLVQAKDIYNLVTLLKINVTNSLSTQIFWIVFKLSLVLYVECLEYRNGRVPHPQRALGCQKRQWMQGLETEMAVSLLMGA